MHPFYCMKRVKFAWLIIGNSKWERLYVKNVLKDSNYFHFRKLRVTGFYLWMNSVKKRVPPNSAPCRLCSVNWQFSQEASTPELRWERDNASLFKPWLIQTILGTNLLLDQPLGEDTRHLSISGQSDSPPIEICSLVYCNNIIANEKNAPGAATTFRRSRSNCTQ